MSGEQALIGTLIGNYRVIAELKRGCVAVSMLHSTFFCQSVLLPWLCIMEGLVPLKNWNNFSRKRKC